MTTTDVPERYARQDALAPHEKMAATEAVVVGCGAVGRQVATLLAGMGVGRLTLWDHDHVEEVNRGPQGWRGDQLGLNKARAVSADLMAEHETAANPYRFARSDWQTLFNTAVFCCVDSMDARRLVFEAAVRAGARWFGDCRVAGETIRVLAEPGPTNQSPYPGTLVRDEDAYQGSCSGARMAIYGATCAATLVVARFAQWLRGVPSEHSDVMLNLFAWDLSDTED